MRDFRPLSARLIRDKETGQSRCFAFIEFASVAEAVAFMDRFGDGPGERFTIEGRAVSLEYCVEELARRGPRMDWVCATCMAQNFARRHQCFKCGSDKTGDCSLVPSASSAVSVAAEACSSSPHSVLVVKHLDSGSDETSVADAFRSYAQVKSVEIWRDAAGRSREVAFVEFHSLDHAKHVMNTATGLRIDGVNVRLAFARSDYQAVVAREQAKAQLQQSHDASTPHDVAARSLMHRRRGGAGQGGHGGANEAGGPVARAPKQARVWPPSFDEDGLAWQFDARSQYFFESETMFYYEPKTKLYFSTKAQCYFQHAPGMDPPFMPYFPAQGTTDASTQPTGTSASASSPDGSGVTQTQTAAGAANATSGADIDNGIHCQAAATDAAKAAGSGASAGSFSTAPGAISFGLKLSGKAGKGGTNNPTKKRHLQDMTKWGSRQKELQEEAEETAAASGGGGGLAPVRQHTVGKYAKASAAQTPKPRQAASPPPAAPAMDATTAALLSMVGGHTTAAASALLPAATATAATSSALPAAALPTVTSPNQHLASLGQDYTSLARLTLDGQPLVKRQGAKWQCLVSRREFSTEEQLVKHIKLSKLYRAELQTAISDGRLALV